MNVNPNAGMQGQMPGGPPKSEDLANRMAQSVANGDVSVEQLQKNISDRLKIEDTSSIVAEDGSLDVEALTELLEINKPSGAGGPPPGGPPPGGPPPGGTNSADGSNLTELLSGILGDDALEEVTEDDGSYDVESLLVALQEKLEATDQSSTGNLVDMLA